mmetsp:Transcript_36947/g.93693  ORF Transcript_36947/g.93693 Transcript_36947/m.93693 type:complete len:216 (+) Transcript_36947:639-1286(+)
MPLVTRSKRHKLEGQPNVHGRFIVCVVGPRDAGCVGCLRPRVQDELVAGLIEAPAHGVRLANPLEVPVQVAQRMVGHAEVACKHHPASGSQGKFHPDYQASTEEHDVERREPAVRPQDGELVALAGQEGARDPINQRTNDVEKAKQEADLEPTVRALSRVRQVSCTFFDRGVRGVGRGDPAQKRVRVESQEQRSVHSDLRLRGDDVLPVLRDAVG